MPIPLWKARKRERGERMRHELNLQKFGKVRTCEPMKKHTSYKIGGKADYYVRPDSMENAISAIQYLRNNDVDLLILGKGSNVLISDEPYHGAVISLDDACSHFEFHPDGILQAGAGCSLIALAKEAEKRSLKGLEFASGIPGTVGGGLYMNAGAYKSDMAAILIDVQVLENDELVWKKKEELDYTYRHSSFQNHKDWIILQARFVLQPGVSEEISALVRNRKERRMSSQPLDKPCAGSVFRNPSGMNAWKIVDDLGFRGLRCGGAQVSEKHTNFIINASGTASAKDVDNLISYIRQAARDRYGVDLVPEVEKVNWHERS